MKALDDDRASVKRQALSNVQNSAAGSRPSQQQHAGGRSNADAGAGCSDLCQHDHRKITARDPGPRDSSDHHCSLPDSQGELADDLASLCAFKSAGTGSRMRVNSPGSIAKVFKIQSNSNHWPLTLSWRVMSGPSGGASLFKSGTRVGLLLCSSVTPALHMFVCHQFWDCIKLLCLNGS